MSKVEFWTLVFGDLVCSKHKTESAARQSARKCEADGGAKHTFVKVTHLPPSRRGPRAR